MITNLQVSKKLKLLGYSRPAHFHWALKNCVNTRPKYKIERFSVQYNWNGCGCCFSAPDVRDVWYWLDSLGYNYRICSETEYILLKNNIQFYRGQRNFRENEMLEKLLDLIIEENGPQKKVDRQGKRSS